jgi:tRNA1(Val) A37 N6-methylase TrmN6
MNTEINTLLNGKVKIIQNKKGFKVSSDAVFLQSAFSFYKLTQKKNRATVLDIGCGNGGIIFPLAYRFKNLKITGIELQKDLFFLCQEGIKTNKLSKQIKAINANITELKNIFKPCSLDYIITNPPFYKGLKSTHSNKATAHTISEITIKNWIEISLKFIKPQGGFLTIIKPNHIHEILYILHKNNFGRIEIFPLLSKSSSKKAERVIIKAQKNTKTPAEIYNPIILHKENGDYTKAADEILKSAKSIYDVI